MLCCVVVHGCVVLQSVESQPVAARALHAELARLLDAEHGQPLHLPDHVIEDIKGNPLHSTPHRPSAGTS